MTKRIAIARLWHEGNSFTPVLTRLADFRQKEWTEGERAAQFYALTPIFLRQSMI